MNRKQFLAAMYLRLSRDDRSANSGLDVRDVADKERKTGNLVKTNEVGLVKSESNSIGNQRELIKAFIREQQDMELYDIYIDV